MKIKTGATRSQIGNSPEILRYLWGAYSGTEEADVDHLTPTAERLDFEKRLDRYGVNLQVWVYKHILNNRELTLRLWGVNSPDVPVWQRSILRALFPLQRYLIRKSFRITPESFAATLQDLIGDPETLRIKAENARSIGRPDAVERLANLVESVAGNSA